MLEGVEQLKALQVQPPEKLLSNMTLKRTPEILGLLSRVLNLTDDNIKPSEIKDLEGNVYSFTLVKQQGISRCLLKIPIEISTILGGNKGRIFDILERIKTALLIKFKDDASISILLVHEGKLHVSFKTTATIWKTLHEKLVVKDISIHELLQLREEELEVSRLFLQEFLDLDYRPAEAKDETPSGTKIEVVVSTGTTKPQTGITQPSKTKGVTVLFLAANPTDTQPLDLNEEFNAIEDELERCEFRDQFNLRSRFALKVNDISTQLLKYNPTIVHFSGHGSKSGKIKLQDPSGKAKPVDSSAIAKLFKVLKDNIRCVVLNACYSENQALLIARYVDCVIGMTRKIGDEAAIKFAQGFYKALGFGRDLQTAFDVGCSQIDLEGLDEEDIPKIIWKNDEQKKIVLIDPQKQPGGT